MPIRAKILDTLNRDARLTATEIAVMIGEPEDQVAESIRQMEKEGIILGYRTILNQERINKNRVSCLIEVSVQPERGHGFDKLAERIYRFPEVQSVFLVSRDYDLLINIEGDSMKEIADFVIEKLSTLPNVRSTGSHFILKKYKEAGTILVEYSERERMPVSP